MKWLYSPLPPLLPMPAAESERIPEYNANSQLENIRCCAENSFRAFVAAAAADSICVRLDSISETQAGRRNRRRRRWWRVIIIYEITILANRGKLFSNNFDKLHCILIFLCVIVSGSFPFAWNFICENFERAAVCARAYG